MHTRSKLRISAGSAERTFCGSTPSARRSLDSSSAACRPLFVICNSSSGLTPISRAIFATSSAPQFANSARALTASRYFLTRASDGIKDRMSRLLICFCLVVHRGPPRSATDENETRIKSPQVRNGKGSEKASAMSIFLPKRGKLALFIARPVVAQFALNSIGLTASCGTFGRAVENATRRSATTGLRYWSDGAYWLTWVNSMLK